MKFNVEVLGQVFTPENIVKKMIGMIKNKGDILEPSCGDGAFLKELNNYTAIEIDRNKAPDKAMVMDFFDYSVNNKFETIIGNPPYVSFKDIQQYTKEKLDLSFFNSMSNLYLFFIHKCIQHLKENGELIFIVPRDFLKSTSAFNLNNYIYEQGTITDIIDLGDKNIFKGYNPNCIIFRFEKNDYSRKTNGILSFKNHEGQLLFLKNEYKLKFADLFFVKVGAVSGLDNIFTHEDGNKEFVYSQTGKTKKTKRMYFNEKSKHIQNNKEKLLKRKIKVFNEDNYHQWGRNHFISDKERIYVNCKTRNKKPFFYHQCKDYDGSVLAIFPKFNTEKINMEELANELNDIDWNELGFVCDGRFIFNQNSLEKTLLPNLFEKYIETL